MEIRPKQPTAKGPATADRAGTELPNHHAVHPVHAKFVRLDVSDSQGPVTELSVGDLQVFAGTP